VLDVPSVSSLRRWLHAVASLAVLLSLSQPLFAQAAGDVKAPTSAPVKAETVHTTDFVGNDTCALCHGDLATHFASDPHSKLALMHGNTGATCESCHGPGRAHVESGGDKTKIFDFAKAASKEVDKQCIGCHLDTHANSERTSHAAAGVSCTTCHVVHAFPEEAHLLKAPETKLCTSCHTDVKASFAEPFHHKVNEGVLKCSDCHDPHGTFNDSLLQKSATQDAVCTKCHTETAGPFVYEHPPVKLEGCLSCHYPHGSPNPRLLIRNNVNSMCLQCHSASIDFTAPGTPSFHNQANQYQSCTSCHVQIHGSNADVDFFK
jgi:DmsE family decaheme c-type cytochrome